MRVLIADDCPTTRRVLAKNLAEWGYQVMVVRDGEEALRALQAKFAPRLAILDWMMPNLDGLSVCRQIREDPTSPYVYLIILTAKSEHDDLIEAFDASADDFLSKPVNNEELRQRLRAGQRILELQDRLLATQEKLKFQATHDPLTGVWNRSAILDCLHRELSRAGRQSGNSLSTSLIMADLDHFKPINDRYGHLVGDAILRMVCERVRSVLRSYDSLGRYGGEEFVMILPETDIYEAKNIADRVRCGIADTPFEVDGQSIRITTSLGVATFQGEQPDETALIRVADKALFQAKLEGRNQLVAAPAAVRSEPAMAGEEVGHGLEATGSHNVTT